mmetsp:Transcript_42474/g.120085  ORF Transcript_42474/g.120085 Transcript_42474/m.120085 type:complete len:219 (+) Transcript_42474:114-770(+)
MPGDAPMLGHVPGLQRLDARGVLGAALGDGLVPDEALLEVGTRLEALVLAVVGQPNVVLALRDRAAEVVLDALPVHAELHLARRRPLALGRQQRRQALGLSLRLLRHAPHHRALLLEVQRLGLRGDDKESLFLDLLLRPVAAVHVGLAGVLAPVVVAEAARGVDSAMGAGVANEVLHALRMLVQHALAGRHACHGPSGCWGCGRRRRSHSRGSRAENA